MPSLTGLDEAAILTQAIEFVVQTLADCGYETCATQRTHTRPRKIECCDCAGPDASYTVFGWIERAFEADGRLLPALDNCPTLDALVLGFNVARCWPSGETQPKTGGARDLAAAELALVLGCLRDAFGRCEANPGLFHVEPTEELPDPEQVLCTKMAVGPFTSELDEHVTPYGDGDTVSRWCAGWQWTVTVA